MLLAVSPGLVNQQCILNKVSLNKNTRKTQLCTDQVKMGPEARRNLPLSFLYSSDSGFANSVLAATLWNLTAVNSKNQPYAHVHTHTHGLFGIFGVPFHLQGIDLYHLAPFLSLSPNTLCHKVPVPTKMAIFCLLRIRFSHCPSPLLPPPLL